jgi:protein-tyrosine-phosphatase
VVQPAYRQRPWEAEAVDAASAAAVRIAFVSEAGICRCVLAAAAFRAALAARAPHLAGSVECGCRATRDFCAGEGPAPAAAAAAAELGLALPQRYEAEVFRDSRDIVYFDVVLVMDKFTAADVLREAREGGGDARVRKRGGLRWRPLGRVEKVQARCRAGASSKCHSDLHASMAHTVRLGQNHVTRILQLSPHSRVQVSVFDTIKTWGRAGYSSKVRRLGEFSAALAAAPVAARDPDAADIEDALYGEEPI